MVILHIACIKDNPFNGVCVAVPEHVIAEQKIYSVGLLNLFNYKVNGINNMFLYSEDFSFEKLPSPFNKPDLVVFNECYRFPYLKIAKQLRKLKIPYVVFPHGELTTFAQSKKRLKKTVANVLFFNRFINGARAIQCLSEREMNNTRFKKEKFIGTNGVVLPNQTKEQFNSNKLRLVYIGRLEMMIKGLDLLVLAVNQKRELLEKNDCVIDVYGPDILGRREELEQLIKNYNVERLILLHSPITGEEKKDVLLSSDVFIQTSRTEGMPMGILEAMSYGLPCLITEGTSLAKDVQKNNCGWTCETTAEAIAQAIEKLLEEKNQLSSKSKNARALIEKVFCWEKTAENTLENYRTLVK